MGAEWPGLMFFRQQPSDPKGRGGRTRLYSVDLTGYNLREVVTPGDASDPAGRRYCNNAHEILCGDSWLLHVFC